MQTVLAVSSIPVSPKVTTSRELRDGEDFERKGLRWKRKQGRGNRKGKFIFELWLLPGYVVNKAVPCP